VGPIELSHNRAGSDAKLAG